VGAAGIEEEEEEEEEEERKTVPIKGLCPVNMNMYLHKLVSFRKLPEKKNGFSGKCLEIF
jgi:hypothetical protein